MHPVWHVFVDSYNVLNVGHIDCLAFALQNGHRPCVLVLDRAITGRHLTCVQLLVSYGLPRNPYFGTLITCSDLTCVEPINQEPGPVGPDCLGCLQHVFDNGRRIHTGTLILAATSGDVELVRFLHSRGVALWDRVWDEAVHDNYSDDGHRGCACYSQWRCAKEKTIHIPLEQDRASVMVKSLQHGCFMGAPLSPRIVQDMEAKRRLTRAVLLCFHVAGRRSQHERSRRQRAAWCGMPSVLIEEILML